MESFRGVGICGGIAVGEVRIRKNNDVKFVRERSGSAEAELARFLAAKEAAAEELRGVCERAREEIGLVQAALFEGYLAMVEDPELHDGVEAFLRQQEVTAECAVSEVSEQFASGLGNAEDAYIRARAEDVRYVAQCILRGFGCGEGATGQTSVRMEDASRSTESGQKAVIVCAEEITAEMVVASERDRVIGFVSVRGSEESHSAILARIRKLPGVFGVGAECVEHLIDGQRVLVNGYTGEVVLNPSEELVAAALAQEEILRTENEELRVGATEEDAVQDSNGVRILANIGSVQEASEALENGAEGIGLFRSEVIFLECMDWPTEEQQYEIYRQVLSYMGERPVVIRTLDMGGDKVARYAGIPKEDNPALGLRGIRFSLARPELLRSQLRALYRASMYGNLGILFPMITNATEVTQALDMCHKVREELAAEGVPYKEDVRLGIMIETPAAALISDRLAPMVDFFSIGTNDLTQYTLACDRQNPTLAGVRDTHHEAIMRLIGMTVENARAHGVQVCICGELAGDTDVAKKLLAMGIRELSVAPYKIPKLRQAVRSVTVSP